LAELRDHPGAAASLIGRRLIFDRLHHLVPLVGVETHGVRLLADTRDGFIGRPLFTRRSPAEAPYLRLAVEIARPGRTTFVDVGANIGTTSILAVTRAGFERAVAFEPSPRNLPLLRANVALNRLEDRVTVVPVALGEAAATTALLTQGSNPGDDHVGSGDTVVEMRRLDDALSAAGIEPADVGMLWIDVQGYEPFVLEGAGRYLDAPPPTVIEFWPAGLARAGGAARLGRVIADRYREITDLRESRRRGRRMTLPASRLGDLTARYQGSDHTDLLLR
jgi:FkbM family methyltransferase